MKPRDPHSIPNWEGKIIRVVGTYSARFDPSGTETTIELWIGEEHGLSVVGSLATDSRFDQPVTPINQLYQSPVGTGVHVRGRVTAHEGGATIDVRDESGQVAVRSKQLKRLPLGVTVDAIGTVAMDGPRWVLRDALYRKVETVGAPEIAKGSGDVIESVAELRQLNLDEAARGRPVKISGLVSWSLPGNDFFFLQSMGAIAFYEQLGFDLVMHPAPPFAMLSRGGLRLVLSAPNPMATRARFLSPRPRAISWADSNRRSTSRRIPARSSVCMASVKRSLTLKGVLPA